MLKELKESWVSRLRASMFFPRWGDVGDLGGEGGDDFSSHGAPDVCLRRVGLHGGLLVRARWRGGLCLVLGVPSPT